MKQFKNRYIKFGFRKKLYNLINEYLKMETEKIHNEINNNIDFLKILNETLTDKDLNEIVNLKSLFYQKYKYRDLLAIASMPSEEILRERNLMFEGMTKADYTKEELSQLLIMINESNPNSRTSFTDNGVLDYLSNLKKMREKNDIKNTRHSNFETADLDDEDVFFNDDYFEIPETHEICTQCYGEGLINNRLCNLCDGEGLILNSLYENDLKEMNKMTHLLPDVDFVYSSQMKKGEEITKPVVFLSPKHIKKLSEKRQKDWNFENENLY